MYGKKFPCCHCMAIYYVNTCQYMSIQWLGVVTNAYSMDQGKCRKMQFTSTTMCLNRKLNRQLLSAFVWGCHYPYFEIVLPICT